MAAAWLTSDPSNTAAPTQAEINAGVDLVGTANAEELVEIQGFETQPGVLPTPGYAGTQVGNVAGDETYPESALVFYKDDGSSTIYTAFATAGTTGNVILMFDGQAESSESLLFPARVLSRVRSPALNTPHTFRVNFAIEAPIPGTQAA